MTSTLRWRSPRPVIRPKSHGRHVDVPEERRSSLFYNPRGSNKDRHLPTKHVCAVRRILQSSNIFNIMTERTRRRLMDSLDFASTPPGAFALSPTRKETHQSHAAEQPPLLPPLAARINHIRHSRKLARIVHASPPLFVNPESLGFNVITDRQRLPAGREGPHAPNIIGKSPIRRELNLYEPPINNHPFTSPKESNKLHHLILTWSTSAAHYVEVAGTFTEPPWAVRVPLYWCGTTQTHWVDVHEVSPSACGVQQFKFIVDGVWKCDPSYPICDDGSVSHHLNNVMVIFPHRLRVRLSNQKLLRRQSHQQGFVSRPANATTEGRKSIPTTPQNIDTPLGDLLYDVQTPVVDDLSQSITLPLSLPEVYETSPTGLNKAASPGDPQEDEPPEDVVLSTDGLLRIPSWACRSTMDSNTAAQTTPAALSKSNSRAVLESRWRLAVNLESHKASTPREAPTRFVLDRQSTTPPEPPRKDQRTRCSGKPPIVSAHGAASGQKCRKLLIQSRVQPSSLEAADEEAPKRRRRRQQRPATTDGTLVRCLSHHGGRRDMAYSAEGGSVRLTEWPPSVTDLLHSPEILLQLLLPSNVVKMRKQELGLSAGWAMTPHPEKVATGGADSFYISSDFRCLALADGVGEWDDLGFSPRSYADELMSAVQAVWENKQHPVHRLCGRMAPSVVAREIMRLAHTEPRSYGSATCCIAIFDPKRQQLGICNLGDSGLCILRRGRKYQMVEHFRTTDQSHFFNCPYQLSRSPPPQVLAKIFGIANIENGKGFVLPSEDLPKHANCHDVPVEEGDLILMASDGLWDNLWDFEIRGLCNLALAPFEALILHDETLVTGADTLARAITEAASLRSRDTQARTPFAKSYTTECGMPAYTGGKWDDITTVAAWVARRSFNKNCGAGPSLPPVSMTNTPTVLYRFPYHPQTDPESDYDSDTTILLKDLVDRKRDGKSPTTTVTVPPQQTNSGGSSSRGTGRRSRRTRPPNASILPMGAKYGEF